MTDGRMQPNLRTSVLAPNVQHEHRGDEQKTHDQHWDRAAEKKKKRHAYF